MTPERRWELEQKSKTFCILGIFACFSSSADFCKINVFKISFWTTIRMSNSLDPGQAGHFVGQPDLDLNCL